MKKSLKIIKNTVVIAALFIVYLFLSSAVLPDIKDVVFGNQDKTGQRLLLSLALTIITVFIYKKLAQKQER